MMRLQVVLLLAIVPVVLGANILAVVPVPARSHNILFQRLIISLAEKGHNVTFVNTLPLKKPVPNIKEITLSLTMDEVLKEGGKNLFEMRHQSAFASLFKMPLFGYFICDSQLQSPQMQELLASDSKFDLIISESFLIESINAGLAERFQVPLIGFTTIQPNIWVNINAGNIAPTSYISDPFLGYPQRMTFLQRFANLVYQTIDSLQYNLIYIPKQEKIYHKYFGTKATPLLEHLQNISIVFTNDHFSLTFPRPLIPNIVPIGGVHVAPPKKLPQDIQKYLDNSKNGAILFSMGSNLKSSSMPQEKINIFLNVFSRLKQNVLWKFETDLERKPPNVLISDWLPQSDILAHKNLKLFITHGGLLSTTESMERGVPVVGIPIFGDQPMNMKQSVNAGVGLSLDYDAITEQNLEETLREVLENAKYREAAQVRSRLLKDQPLSAIDSAHFWIEYVLRHKGAPHLRSALLNLTWYEAYQVDVIALLVIIAVTVSKVLLVILRAIISKLCGSKNIAEKKKNQ